MIKAALWEGSPVTPFTGVWIEIQMLLRNDAGTIVTPFTGVWIEMRWRRNVWRRWWSHPSRVCGLKFPYFHISIYTVKVTPFTGVWIEIQNYACDLSIPHWSHPSRVCGLK